MRIGDRVKHFRAMLSDQSAITCLVVARYVNRKLLAGLLAKADGEGSPLWASLAAALRVVWDNGIESRCLPYIEFELSTKRFSTEEVRDDAAKVQIHTLDGRLALCSQG